MIAKEKARMLYDQFFDIGADCGSFDTNWLAEQCALIVVDEILDLDSGDSVDKDYWQEVKEEIKKL